VFACNQGTHACWTCGEAPLWVCTMAPAGLWVAPWRRACGVASWRLLACGVGPWRRACGVAPWCLLACGVGPWRLLACGLHHGAEPVVCTMAPAGLWVGPWRLLACGLHHGAEPVVCTMAPAGLWVTPWRPLAASHKPQGSDATVHHSHSASQPQCTAAMPHRSHALSLASGTVTPRQHYPQHAS